MIELNSYEELGKFFQAFRKGNINLLVIESRGGLGKTSLAEKTIPNAKFIRGHATPLSIYLEFHKEQPELVVFDDVETLLKNKRNTTLLKQICDTKPIKTVNYYSTHTVDGLQIPSTITTGAKVLVLTNELGKQSKDIVALLTRGHYVKFNPTSDEVMKQIKSFKEIDSSIYEELLKVSVQCMDLNFRHYVKTKELKDSGLDWKKYLYEMSVLDKKLKAFLRVYHMDISEDEKAQLFCDLSGMSIRTYYNVKKDFADNNPSTAKLQKKKTHARKVKE